MNVQMMFYALLGILSVVVTVLAVPLIRKNHEVKDIEKATRLVGIGTKAAEQLLKETDPTGEKRREYLNKFLKKNGVTLTERELEGMREAAVYEINKWKKALLANDVTNINVK